MRKLAVNKKKIVTPSKILPEVLSSWLGWRFPKEHLGGPFVTPRNREFKLLKLL